MIKRSRTRNRLSGAIEEKNEGSMEKAISRDVLHFVADQPHGYRNIDTELSAEFHNLI